MNKKNLATILLATSLAALPTTSLAKKPNLEQTANWLKTHSQTKNQDFKFKNKGGIDIVEYGANITINPKNCTVEINSHYHLAPNGVKHDENVKATKKFNLYDVHISKENIKRRFYSVPNKFIEFNAIGGEDLIEFKTEYFNTTKEKKLFQGQFHTTGFVVKNTQFRDRYVKALIHAQKECKKRGFTHQKDLF